MVFGAPCCKNAVATPQASGLAPFTAEPVRSRGDRILARWSLLVSAPRAGRRPSRPPMGSRKLGAALRFLVSLSALLAVFAAYLDPHLAVDLANRVWSCF